MPHSVGRPSKVGADIHTLCMDLWANQGRSLEWISEYLLHTYKIENAKRPGEPVCQSTVQRWIRKASKRMSANPEERRMIEFNAAAVELRGLKERIYSLIHEHRVEVDDPAQLYDFLDNVLKIQDRQVKLHGIAAAVKVETTQHVVAEPKPIPKETEETLAALQAMVNAEYAKYGARTRTEWT